MTDDKSLNIKALAIASKGFYIYGIQDVYYYPLESIESKTEKNFSLFSVIYSLKKSLASSV